MGIFLDYGIVVRQNLNVRGTGEDDPTILLTADTSTIFVNDITVCNTSANTDIRINLVVSQAKGTGEPVEAYRLKNVVVKASASTDLMQLLVDQSRQNGAGGGLYLAGVQNSDDGNNVTTSLVLFTNSQTQTCDCTVNYAVLNETPWGGPC